jgi:hypothetical protein
MVRLQAHSITAGVQHLRGPAPPPADNRSYRHSRVVFRHFISRATVTSFAAPVTVRSRLPLHRATTTTCLDLDPQPSSNSPPHPSTTTTALLIYPSKPPLEAVSCSGHAGRSSLPRQPWTTPFKTPLLNPDFHPASGISNYRQHVEPPTPDRDRCKFTLPLLGALGR